MRAANVVIGITSMAVLSGRLATDAKIDWVASASVSPLLSIRRR